MLSRQTDQASVLTKLIPTCTTTTPEPEKFTTTATKPGWYCCPLQWAETSKPVLVTFCTHERRHVLYVMHSLFNSWDMSTCSVTLFLEYFYTDAFPRAISNLYTVGLSHSRVHCLNQWEAAAASSLHDVLYTVWYIYDGERLVI